MKIRFYHFLLLLNAITAYSLAGANHCEESQPSTLRVLGVQGAVLFETQIAVGAESVAEISHRVLSGAIKSNNLQQYEGSELGIRSINNLGSALELISNTEMDAYGWCYRIDGKLSELLADKHKLRGDERLIEWFYAYAHFDKTQWTSMCIPAQHIPDEE